MARTKARRPIAGMSLHVLDCHDLDEITVQHAVEHLEWEIVDEAMAHAELIRNGRHEGPADGMRDDIPDGLIDSERESLAESCAFVLVPASRGTELDKRRPEDPMRVSTGHASGFASARRAARRVLRPMVSNRSRRRRRPRCAA
jgi:hypothetical protein